MSSMKNLDALFAAYPEKNKTEPGTLYLTATPIGNTMDITARALKILSEVSFVAAEDTRNTGRLLAFYGIDKPLVSYFEHNKRQRGIMICDRLAKGESCALVTDAGMPAISDPGEDLVLLCQQRQIPVRCVPGCCAVPTAVALSGLPTGRFVFEGFLPTAKGERRERLQQIAAEYRTIVLYEAPHRLAGTLSDLCNVLGPDRQLALCRELTKRNEQTVRTTLALALQDCAQTPPRGEYVLVVQGAKAQPCAQPAFWSNMQIQEHVTYYLQQTPSLQKNEALKLVAKDRGMSKSAVYRMLLEEDRLAQQTK
ncbi:MAG: 16S rRNA (cytidine(1402)-2'-O)-methyltransferase [Eubacteriales bacterium]|nr:16S rRNA (cytidine(1402)-2'-O)-methyltransferase [Eubacteriales bacterium]